VFEMRELAGVEFAAMRRGEPRGRYQDKGECTGQPGKRLLTALVSRMDTEWSHGPSDGQDAFPGCGARFDEIPASEVGRSVCG